jgi:hypothetical protein
MKFREMIVAAVVFAGAGFAPAAEPDATPGLERLPGGVTRVHCRGRVFDVSGKADAELVKALQAVADAEASGKAPAPSPCPDGKCQLRSPVAQPRQLPAAVARQLSGNPGDDALSEVNAKRAARGLRPFVRDEGLTQAARASAAFRAQHLLFGHTANDFAFVPRGTACSSTGCAAYPASFGWMSCCVYDNYTHAGAAWVMGRDGKRYCHLFVR